MNGSVDIEGSVSYVSQDPWILSGTIRENILFDEKLDKVWYRRVVECCSLVKVTVWTYICVIVHVCVACMWWGQWG